MIKIIKISSYVDTLFFILGFKDKDKSFIDLKKKSQIYLSYNISQNECFKKLFQNLINFILKKKEKENRNLSRRKNIDEKASMCHRYKVSRSIVYKLYVCAHIGQTSTIHGHDTMNYLFIVLSIGETLGTKVLQRNVASRDGSSGQDVKTLSRFANRE